MMIKFLLLFFPLFSCYSEENLISLNLKAESLFEAHDYAAAVQIYENLLKDSLPDWQKARLFYNMGTIRLAQNHPYQSLTLFQKIDPTDLSLPSFGKNLSLNEGIAYLQYTQFIALDPNSRLVEQSIFIEQSLQAFDQAQQLECQTQTEKSSSFCDSSPLLSEWIKIAHLKSNEIFEKKRLHWMENGTIESIASFLQMNMEKWRIHFEKFHEQPQITILSYFQLQGESFDAVWNLLESKELTLDQKNIFQKAKNAYLNALQHLEQQDVASTIKQWEQSVESLTSLTFHENSEIQYAKLSYESLLLQPTLTTSSLKELLTLVESLNVKKENISFFEQIKGSLKASVESLKNQDIKQAQFFLFSGYSQFYPLFPKNDSSPARTLQEAINQASCALQLTFLADNMSKQITEQTHSILESQQKNTLIQASSFIPAVLKEQDARFHQTKDVESRCQQIPWNQVIPLFDRGFRSAQEGDKNILETTWDFQAMITGQIETIKNWEEALHLILHPPQQQGAASTTQNWTETIRQIQEMILQDQPQSNETTKELHSW